MNIVTKILMLLLFTGLVGCNSTSDREEYAEMIIEKVEEFQNNNGRLPNDVTEIGLTEIENSSAFYEKTSDTTYIVWYGLSLGESKTYSSKTNKWTKGG